MNKFIALVDADDLVSVLHKVVLVDNIPEVIIRDDRGGTGYWVMEVEAAKAPKATGVTFYKKS